MFNYRKVVKVRQAAVKDDAEIRVTVSGSVAAYVSRAGKLFGEFKLASITITAAGNALPKAVASVEIIKRRVKGLHQVTKIGSQEIVDEYEPLEEGLDNVTETRSIACLEITLSKEVLDNTLPGYQEPLDEALVEEKSFEELMKPRGDGKGRSKGKGKGKPKGKSSSGKDGKGKGWKGPGSGKASANPPGGAPRERSAKGAGKGGPGKSAGGKGGDFGGKPKGKGWVDNTYGGGYGGNGGGWGKPTPYPTWGYDGYGDNYGGYAYSGKDGGGYGGHVQAYGGYGKASGKGKGKARY